MINIHIGKLIENELKRQERTPTWLASKLYCCRTNIYKIFQKKSIDSDTLYRISIVLNHNFFEYYNNEFYLECDKKGTQP